MNTILTPEDIERHIGYRLPAGAMNLLLGLIAEREAAVLAKLREQEPAAMRYDFDGYGYRYIDSGSGSDWRTRIPDAEAVYAAPLPAVVQVPQERSALLTSLKSSQSALRKLSFKDDATSHALERLTDAINALEEQA